ncbi:hypothetical protein [Streptomyces sp. NPDC026659]
MAFNAAGLPNSVTDELGHVRSHTHTTRWAG